MSSSSKSEFDENLRSISDPALRSSLKSQFDLISGSDDPAKNAEVLRLIEISRHFASANSNTSWIFHGSILVLITLVFSALIYRFVGGLSTEQLLQPAAARPLILIVIIAAMLGFGGLLIIRPMFVTLDFPAFADRFRLSREIFLVFSGVFATVIGFYFGSLDKSNALDQSQSLSIDQEVGKNGEFVVTLTGGADLEKVNLLTLGGVVLELEVQGIGSSRYALSSRADQDCPSGGLLTVTDSAGRTVASDIVKLTPSLLFAGGWKKCEAMSSEASGAKSSVLEATIAPPSSIGSPTDDNSTADIAPDRK